MEFFRFKGQCTRRDYAELWVAAIIIIALVVLASKGGWLTLPSDRCFLLSLEYLPLVVQVVAPLAAVAWMLLASTIRRSRDCRFPVTALILCLAFYALAVAAASTTTKADAPSYYFLKAIVVLASALLGLIFSGLFLVEDFGVGRRAATVVKRADPDPGQGDALFGRRQAAKLVAEWHRRASRQIRD